ncbi:unnamed protein product [Nippostrongylus brasiliensis]|uniref:NTR-1 (inferred by orthology to a C. elegans protein) n=1 Tax=Nippostrongylus brasiliensis TaxID=27835 RepID=A0A0N4Y4P7_NIPBR|nr:unnamed protein product [Nippostrongylus brasiliensis]
MILHHLAIILLTIIGNTLLIYVILKNNVVRRRKRITPVQMLMLHMCAADLLFALITMVPTMAMTATVPVFHGPNVLCKFVKFLQVIPMYASSFLLVAISADRFQAICRPLASMKSNAYKRPALYASAAWALALLFSTPQFALFAKRDGDCVGTYTNPYQYAIYVIVFNTVVWLLPSAIAGYLYYQVCRAVWQSTSFGSAFSPSERSNSYLSRKTAQYPTFATYIMFFGNLNSVVNPWIWFYFNRAQIKRAIPCYSSTDPLLLWVSFNPDLCIRSYLDRVQVFSGRRNQDGTTDYSNECHPATESFKG